MKHRVILSLFLALCMPLTACSLGSGNTKNVIIDYGTSTLFSEAEIESAVNTVIAEFSILYGDCKSKLIKIWYDEARFVRGLEAGEAADGNIIVLFTEFTTGQGFGNPNLTYYDMGWVLIRDDAHSEWSCYSLAKVW